MMSQAKIRSVADEVLAALGRGTSIPPFSLRPDGLSVAEARKVTPLLRAAFEARGERIVGRKIGFTNRLMWQTLGVTSPVWGYMTSCTVHDLSDVAAVSLHEFAEPRIEPEIVFGLRATPAAAASPAELLDCVAWLALGYEIVQSIYPGWSFAAADTIAANGLHGALLIGPRHRIAARASEWERELAAFEVELSSDDGQKQRGGGALVLGSPLSALRHLVEVLAADVDNPPLAPDEIISTGTLTLAMPVRPGERWTTRAHGSPLGEIAVRFA